jgi:pyridoxine 4-dehydrogenase
MTTASTTIDPTARPAAARGTFHIGGDLPVVRLGHGAMRLTGPGIWGPPRDRDEAMRVLRRAAELGMTLIDTADSYGPCVSEELSHAASTPIRWTWSSPRRPACDLRTSSSRCWPERSDARRC